MAPRTKLHFARYEFKYILTAALRRELESEFQYFVELDPFTAQRPGAKYFVRSLYFDNEAFDLDKHVRLTRVEGGTMEELHQIVGQVGFCKHLPLVRMAGI